MRPAPRSLCTQQGRRRFVLAVIVNDPSPGPGVSRLLVTPNRVHILEPVVGDDRAGPARVPDRSRAQCELSPIPTPHTYGVRVWLSTTYDNLELHEGVTGFSVDGDDLGRLRCLVKIGSRWDVEWLDEP
jgi:hypothetical protein